MESIWSQFSTMWWMQGVSTVLPVSTATLITRSRAMEEVMLVATTTATTSEVNKLWGEKSSRSWWSVHTNLTPSTTNLITIGSSRETGRSVLEQGRCVFPARTTPDQSFKKVREMINNLITRLKEDTFSEDEHNGLCGTELTTNARPQLKTSMENLAKDVAKLFAQVSHQVDNDLFVKVKKLIQDLIWKLQRKFLRKDSVIPRCHNSTNCSETSLQEEVSNANYIHNEVTTTNEESIKDVQDVQSSLMKAIQILTDFFSKAGEGNDSHTAESVFPKRTTHWPGMLLRDGQWGARFTTEIRW